MLDHILISDEMFSALISNSAGFIPNLTSDINLFNNSTSDHLPVTSRFDFSQPDVTSIEDRHLKQGFSIEPPYPNPFSNLTSFSITLERTAWIKVEVFDLLGRQVDTLVNGLRASGVHQITFRPKKPIRGIYMIRISSDNFTKTLPITFVN